ncbi:ribose-phosphate pyrophosphokinase [Aeromonas phage BUCT695]|uniref:ribose-phosphate pyrophosphokinase n=1 Tax=Aeromonas phage BUCT695 TaxID=2908630 RepID=UPI0023298BB1|nr:ribose-phosphate pyrophosphokinase [Aeromonas phage BUCT695]UIW10485.1 ribose-phosphate pyrophosphokinase [Aeromonas phage BUCT695]
MITMSINGIKAHFEQIRFSDGTWNLKLTSQVPVSPERATIYATMEYGTPAPAMFMEIAQAVDVLRGTNPDIAIRLVMPYLPYARQDRHMVIHDSFDLKIFCQMINALNLIRVVVCDTHSNVSDALLNNVTVIQQSQLFAASAASDNVEVICAPDMGALKKARACAKAVGCKRIVVLDKVRNPENGEITGMAVIQGGEHIANARITIVDDICDGGRTFIGANELLRANGAREVHLHVTHGLFSQGIEALHGLSSVSCYDTVFPKENWSMVNQGYNFGCESTRRILNTIFHLEVY